MAVEKALTPFDMEESEDLPVEVEIEGDDGEEFGEIIEFDTSDVEAELENHEANMAEFLSEKELNQISSDLVAAYEDDVVSRSEWEAAYVKGLDLLGLKVEDRSDPWDGASGVYHPILTESVIRFQAQAMGEIFPASGPARTKIVGEATLEVLEQSKRVEGELNHLTTDKMTEYRDETELMLFRLPLAGSAFKKIYYDPIEERPASMFVPAEDLVVSYGSSDLRSAERYTHRMYKTTDELDQLMNIGFYRSIDLVSPVPETTPTEDKNDEISGSTPTSSSTDTRHLILEAHVNIDLPPPFDDEDGLARPYVVTIEKASGSILSIRRNWYEEDQKKRKRMHFVHYRYLPGMGFYGIGMIHLLGGLTKSATSILRQLIDAGTLANLPAGLKSKGLRIKGDNTPFRPGEFRDVDVLSGSIRDNITFLPYKEPSTVLHALLGNVVEEARRIGSVADIDVGGGSKDAPVGTTLALMERSLKVMSGVQARLHAALKEELRIIARCVYDYMPDNYSYDVDGDFSRKEDFSGKTVDVIPVSDPNAATMSQRVMQYQAATQLAQQAPQLYDMGKLHRQMLETLGIQDADEIVKLPDDIKPMDPVTENMAILKQEPVKPFLYQDHKAHIQTHMAAMNDPKIAQLVGQSPFAASIQAAMHEHITAHVAFEYRKSIEAQLGVSLPDPEAPLPEDVEIEVSRLAAQAADKLLGKHQAEVAAEDAKKKQEDPLVQMQLRELKMKEDKVKGDHDIALKKLKLEEQRNNMNIDIQEERIVAENQRKGAEVATNIATKIADIASKEKLAGLDIGIDVAKHLSDVNQRIDVNKNDDNSNE